MATITMATITLAIIAASRATVPLAIAVLTIGMLGALVTLRRHRDRVALELRMLQALVQSRHRCPRGGTIPGLTADVGAEAMPDGVTRIEAESWLDAIRALGFAVGRDRGFQLERLRRVATGRLSQVWGRAALPLDTGYRALGLAGAAKRALDALEEDERDLLEAFATGVNAAWDCGGPPFECRFLAYDPQPWTPTDSLVIALLLFHGLSWNEQLRRAEAVIRHVFPEPVARFFLPDGAGEDPGLPERLEAFRATAPAADVVLVDPVVTGSNCWIGSGPEGPVLACDLHVPLSIPNALYEVDLRWPEGHVRGLISPGLPVVLTGTNGRLAWGITNLSADVLDLGPTDGDGSATVTDRELIRVRGHPDVVLEVARAGAIPVSARLLLGRQVALRWTGFDARSCDLKLQRLAQASSVDESIAILDGAHGVALNVLFADESGRMAHLATGLLPRRGPGEVSPDRADGYVTGPERPRVVDPADGLLVSANDAALPERTRRITYDPDPGHRARRVRQLLMEAQDRVPATMRAMQHDTRAEAYLAYRHLALAAVRRRGGDDRVAAVLAAWDGNAAV